MGGIFLLVLFFGLYRWSQTRQNQDTNEEFRDKISRYNAPRDDRLWGKLKRTSSNIFGRGMGDEGGLGLADPKRATELLADPTSFAAPRPAPKPNIKKGADLGYTTTTERMRDRHLSTTSTINGDAAEYTHRLQPYTGLIVESPYSVSDDGSPSMQEVEKSQYTPLTRTPAQDFSRERSSVRDPSRGPCLVCTIRR
jgi:hypothetical protein